VAPYARSSLEEDRAAMVSESPSNARLRILRKPDHFALQSPAPICLFDNEDQIINLRVVLDLFDRECPVLEQ
jgi:hypothetical protein